MTGRAEPLRELPASATWTWWRGKPPICSGGSLGPLRAWIKDDFRHVYYPLLIIFFAVFLFHPGGLAKPLPRR